MTTIIEYGVRVHDGYLGTHTKAVESEWSARQWIDYYKRLDATRGTYGVRGVLVTREPDGEWTEADR